MLHQVGANLITLLKAIDIKKTYKMGKVPVRAYKGSR